VNKNETSIEYPSPAISNIAADLGTIIGVQLVASAYKILEYYNGNSDESTCWFSDPDIRSSLGNNITNRRAGWADRSNRDAHCR
jgi:hypothetical protein